MVSPRRLLCALLVAGLLGAGACSDPAPAHLAVMLDTMPAASAQRGLFYSDVHDDRAFGSALPLRRAVDVLGVDDTSFEAVLETGGAPLTVLAGSFRVRDVADAAERAGYTIDEHGEWVVFERTEGADSGGPFVAAVPAGAVTPELLVLGAPEEVRAAAGGDAAVADEPGVGALADALPPGHAAALLVSADPVIDAARDEGGVPAVLARSAARGDLPDWQAAALSWHDDVEDGENGAVLLAIDAEADGHEVARALVLRAATSPLLGEGRRVTAELFDRGAPRWDPERGVVRLPVRWAVDPAAVRSDVESGALLFLAPSP